MRGLLRRLRDRDPFVTFPLGVAVVVVVAVLAGQPPSVATAEKRAARAASQQHGLPLVAACSTPTRTGYVCRCSTPGACAPTCWCRSAVSPSTA